MQFSAIKAKIQSWDHAELIQKLAPYVTERRKALIEKVVTKRLHSVQVALEAPSDIHNAAAVVRTCEALGVSQVHIIAVEGSAVQSKRVTQGAFHWVDIQYHENLDNFLAHCRHEAITLAGASMAGPTPLPAVPITSPLCLLLGNEQKGLSTEAKTACDYEYHIPMFGMSESLNLSVSAAISLYDTTSRKRQLLGTEGDLSSKARQFETAACYANSVEERLLDAL